VHICGDDRAHHRELQQCSAVHSEFAPEVEHVGVAVTRADARDDRGAIDAVDRLQHEATGRHQRAGVACADARSGLAGFDEIDRHAHGGIFLAPQSVLRLLVHRDDLRRLVQANARAQLRGASRSSCSIGSRRPTSTMCRSDSAWSARDGRAQ
jgi:hypothetical protein